MYPLKDIVAKNLKNFKRNSGFLPLMQPKIADLEAGLRPLSPICDMAVRDGQVGGSARTVAVVHGGQPGRNSSLRGRRCEN